MSPHKNKKAAPRTFASPLEGALFMAAKGFRVFPLQPNTKDPFELAVTPHKYRAVAGGINIATSNEKRIRRWAEVCPGINFGVFAGDGVIVDVDRKNDRDGFAAYTRDFGELPDTFRINTPSGGAHLYHDDEPCGQRPLIRGFVDIRSHNGYVVCPGSVFNGKSYTVARDVPRLPLPANVKEALSKKPEKNTDWNKWACAPDSEHDISRAIEWLKSLAEVSEGQRNNEGYKVAAYLKDIGLSPETSSTLMIEHWKCDLEGDEIEDLCRNAHKSGQSPPGYLSREAMLRDFADVFSDPDLKAYWAKQDEKKRETPKPPVLSPKQPYLCARSLIGRRYARNKFKTLHRYRGEFLRYAGTHYESTDDEMIRSTAWHFLHRATKIIEDDDGKKVTAPFDPQKSTVAAVLEATISQTQLRVPALPCWFGDAGDRPAATEMLACRNGLLHLPTRTLYPHTPAFVGLNSLPYAYDPSAGKPKELLKFLRSIWDDDKECVALLQQWFGYLLSGDTRQQKILLLIGAKRGGKGVILRLARALIGEANTCGPTLGSLTSQFGLEPLLGKQLATISDARLSKNSDAGVIVEKLLSVSGEDAQSVSRKFLPAWEGRLPTRFMIGTNAAMKLTDAAGALVSRLLVLPFRKSFLGSEDRGLEARLTAELPSVLNWALDGLDQLNKAGTFKQPQSGQQQLETMIELTQNVETFIKECCEPEPKSSVATDDLYQAYRTWCGSKGINPLANNAFGGDLQAARPDIVNKQRVVNGKRERHYFGMRLLPDWTALGMLI